MVERVEEVYAVMQKVNPQNIASNFANTKDALLIRAILAVGAEINMLRVALNSNTDSITEMLADLGPDLNQLIVEKKP